LTTYLLKYKNMSSCNTLLAPI